MSDADGRIPASKYDVLGFLADSWADVEAVIAEFTDEELTEPGTEGWSAKDHLAHLTAWQSGIVAVFRREERLAAMGVSADLWETEDDDEINAFLQHRDADVPLADVVSGLRLSYRDLLAALEPLSWDDLLRPYSEYLPETGPSASNASASNPIGYSVAGNTFGHYPDHVRWMRDLIAANRAASEAT